MQKFHVFSCLFRKKYLISDRNLRINYNCMPQILSKEIRNRIVSGGENKMYTISDFADLNNDSLVTRVLSRLEEEGMLVRLTQGLYLYPKQTRFGIVKPTPYEIAQAVAGKDHAKVIPSGAMALNELGLSTQIPTNAVFITNGTPRTIKVGNQTITLKRAVPKMFSFQSTLFPLAITAMRDLGAANVDDTMATRIIEILSKDDKEAIKADFLKAPAWIRKKLAPLYS